MRARQPIFNSPPGISAIVLGLVALHALRLVLSEDAADTMLTLLALLPQRYTGGAVDLVGGTVAAVTSLVTYMALHYDIWHLLLNAGLLLALGSLLERRMGVVRMTALLIVSGIGGAIAHLAAHWGSQEAVIGISGGIGGLFGAMLRLLYPAMRAGAGGLLRVAPEAVPAITLSQTLGERQLLLWCFVWIVSNPLFALASKFLTSAGGIAWEAHIGGFVAGFLAFGLLDRGPFLGDGEDGV